MKTVAKNSPRVQPPLDIITPHDADVVLWGGFYTAVQESIAEMFMRGLTTDEVSSRLNTLANYLDEYRLAVEKMRQKKLRRELEQFMCDEELELRRREREVKEVMEFVRERRSIENEQTE
jgi:hypothetical protein